MIKLELMIYKSPPVRFLIRLAKRITLPIEEKLSLYEVGRFLLKELRSVRLNEKAAAVTYNFLMAMAPSFLFLFSLIPYLHLTHVETTVLNTLKLMTPNAHIYDNVSKVVVDFLHTRRKDVLSFGILLVLFFSSNGMMGLMRSFDATSHAFYKKRSGFKRRLTAIKLTAIMICLGVISLALLIVQTTLLNKWLIQIFRTVTAIKILSGVILAGVVFCAISIVYAYGPSLEKRFKFVSAGSVFATVLSLIGTSVFFFLVNHFINYNKVYGSIGTLIAFMVWVWLNTMIILIGYELNISILLGKMSQAEDAEKEK